MSVRYIETKRNYQGSELTAQIFSVYGGEYSLLIDKGVNLGVTQNKHPKNMCQDELDAIHSTINAWMERD